MRHDQLAQLLLFNTYASCIALVSLSWHQQSSRVINDKFSINIPIKGWEENRMECGIVLHKHDRD